MKRIYTSSRDYEKIKTQLGAVIDVMPCFTQTKRIDFEKLEKKRKEEEARLTRRRKMKPARVYIARSILLAISLTAMIGLVNEDQKWDKQVFAEGLQKTQPTINLYEEKPNKVLKLRTKADEIKIQKEAINAYIEKKFGEDAGKAIDCFSSESGLYAQALNTKNTNGTWDYGVAQINSVHCPKVGTTDKNVCKDIFFDYKKNIDMAYKIYKDRGFNAWYACKQYWK